MPRLVYGRLISHQRVITFPNEYHAYPQRRIAGCDAHEDAFKLGGAQRGEFNIEVLLPERGQVR